jgi:hypothetical protein
MGGPVDERIDLAVPAVRRLWKKATLREKTVLRSFAFDEVNKRLYKFSIHHKPYPPAES